MSFVDYFMKYLPFPAIPSHLCSILLPILQFDHFSASPLVDADSQSYPMHMRLNGASKTLIRLIEGVLPISHLIQCKNTVPWQQSDRYSAPRAATKRARRACWRSRLRRGGRSEWRPSIDEWGRWTVHHGCLVVCGVLTVVFLVQNSPSRSPVH